MSTQSCLALQALALRIAFKFRWVRISRPIVSQRNLIIFLKGREREVDEVRLYFSDGTRSDHIAVVSSTRTFDYFLKTSNQFFNARLKQLKATRKRNLNDEKGLTVIEISSHSVNLKLPIS